MLSAFLNFKTYISSALRLLVAGDGFWQLPRDGSELLRALCTLGAAGRAGCPCLAGVVHRLGRLSFALPSCFRAGSLALPVGWQSEVVAASFSVFAFDGLGKGLGNAGKAISKPDVHAPQVFDILDGLGSVQSYFEELSLDL